MSINFILFDSVADFQNYVERTIAETKTMMGSQMRIIDEVKRKNENLKNKGGRAAGQSQRTDIAGFKVLVNPGVEHELRLMEETFSALQDRLTEFERTKEMFPHVKDATKVGIVLEDGLPSGFMLYTNKK